MIPAADLIPKLVYVEPQHQEVCDWDPSRMRSAWEQAENGDLCLAADLLKRALQDDRIKRGFKKRCENLLKCDLTFEASGDRRKSKRVVRVIEADDDFEAIASEDVLEQLLQWGFGLGVALAEKVWTRSPEHGDRDLPVLKIWNPRWLRYDKGRRAWFVQVEGQPEVQIQKNDPKWFLFFPYGEHECWAQGLWWPLAFWWLAKILAVNDWAAFSKAAGSPIPIGSAPEQSTQTTRDNWQKQLQDNLRRGRAAVLPPGYKIDYLLAPADCYETFLEKIRLANTSIDITIVNGNLGSEVGGGSLAAAEVHERGEQGQAEADGRKLGGQLRLGVLSWWALFNFGDRQLAPWPFWDTEPPEDQKKKGEGLVALGSGIEKLSAALAPLRLELDPTDITAMLAKVGLKTRPRPAAPVTDPVTDPAAAPVPSPPPAAASAGSPDAPTTPPS